MRFSPFIFLLCTGVLGCGTGTKTAETPTASPQAETENNKGLAFVEREDWDTAITCYTEAIRLDPEDALAYINRSNIYRKQGNKAKAEADYAKYEELK